jgi:hypothetical protein
VAELVDALDSKSNVREDVRVRVPSPALFLTIKKIVRNIASYFLVLAVFLLGNSNLVYSICDECTQADILCVDDTPGSCQEFSNPGTAAAASTAGDTILIKAGTYPHFTISRSGTAAAPITFKAYPGDELQARITENNYTQSQGIRVDEADHIVIEGLWINQVNQGIYVYQSDYVVAKNCKVTSIGQECMRFKFSNNGAFRNNYIAECGLAGSNGEGIYVGSAPSQDYDPTFNVRVSGNEITNVTDEGIELKHNSRSCIVEKNYVHNAVIRDGGGINVQFADADTSPAGHIIRGNIVSDISTRTTSKDGNGIRMGNGGMVYNNVLFNNQHAGIRIDDKEKRHHLVKVFNNTFYNNGTNPIDVYTGPAIDIRNNLGPSSAGNMEARSEYFINIAEGDFHLHPNSAPVDSGQEIPEVANDADDISRPQGTGWDYGAYEYRLPLQPAAPENLVADIEL